MPTTFTNYGVTISDFGTADVLTLQPHLPLPTINEQQVLIETHYAGITTSPTNELTILPKAPPMITPTAISTTLPRMANFLNSPNISCLLSG